jgi:hypothetical protein
VTGLSMSARSVMSSSDYNRLSASTSVTRLLVVARLTSVNDNLSSVDDYSSFVASSSAAVLSVARRVSTGGSVAGLSMSARSMSSSVNSDMMSSVVSLVVNSNTSSVVSSGVSSVTYSNSSSVNSNSATSRSVASRSVAVLTVSARSVSTGSGVMSSSVVNDNTSSVVSSVMSSMVDSHTSSVVDSNTSSVVSVVSMTTMSDGNYSTTTCRDMMVTMNASSTSNNNGSLSLDISGLTGLRNLLSGDETSLSKSRVITRLARNNSSTYNTRLMMVLMTTNTSGNRLKGKVNVDILLTNVTNSVEMMLLTILRGNENGTIFRGSNFRCMLAWEEHNFSQYD